MLKRPCGIFQKFKIICFSTGNKWFMCQKYSKQCWELFFKKRDRDFSVNTEICFFKKPRFTEKFFKKTKIYQEILNPCMAILLAI